MEEKRGKSKFGLGLLIGGLVGAVSGLLLAPKSGKQTRKEILKKARQLQKLLEEKEVDKKIKEIFGQVTEEGKKIYQRAKEELINHLSQLKEDFQKIDKKKYEKVVEEVIKKIEKEFKKDIKILQKLKESLLKKWEAIRKEKDEK